MNNGVPVPDSTVIFQIPPLKRKSASDIIVIKTVTDSDGKFKIAGKKRKMGIHLHMVNTDYVINWNLCFDVNAQLTPSSQEKKAVP